MSIKVNKKRMITELIELIKINSPSKNEQAISRLLTDKFSALGLTVTEDNSTKVTDCNSGNLICELKGSKELTPIMFTAHMDTVSVNKQITPHIKNNYLTSDGTTILGADNKIAIAIYLEVIKLLKENNIEHGPIQFVLTVGEEIGLIGAKAIDRSLLDAKYGYALDHTGQIGDFVTKEKRHVQASVHIKVPLNIAATFSAIKIATKMIKRIRIGQINHDTEVHINHFSGQNDQNRSYENVTINLDIKSFNKLKLDEEIQSIESQLSLLKEEFNIFGSVTMNLISEGYHFNEDDEVVSVAQKAAQQINLSSNFISTNYSSDANIFTNYGIPTLNLAVGYENIHTHLEKYNLNHLTTLTQFVISIIKQTSRTSLS